MRIFSISRPGRSRLRWLIVSGVLAFLCGPAILRAQHPGEARGRVIDAVTGAGVSGARIVLSPQAREALSDGDGRVRIRGLEPGPVEVRVERLGYRSSRTTLNIRNGEVTPFQVVLHPQAIPTDSVLVVVPGRSQRTVGREEIRRSGARTLGDVLADLAGVTVIPRGPAGAQELRVRGGGADQVLVLVDGVVLNDPLTGAVDVSTLAAAGVERVEVFPGARSARFGSAALAGVVVVETRDPTPGLEGAIHGGSLGARGGELAAGLSLGSTSASVGGSFRRADGGFRFQRNEALGGGEHRRRNADLEQRSGRLALRGRVVGGSWDATLRGEELARGIPGKSFAPSDSARQGESGTTASGRWERRDDRGSVAVQASYRERDVRFRDPAPPLGVPFDHRTRLGEARVSLRGEWLPGPTTSRPNRALLGVELALKRQDLRSDALEGGGSRRFLDGTAAVHGTRRLEVLPGSPLVSGALRAHRDGRSGRWLGAHDLTVELDLGPGHLYAAHRSSFSPPTAGDLFFREGVGIRPNPDLRPERVPGEMEVGGSLRAGGASVAFEVAGEVFTGNLVDMIVWAPDFRFVWSPRNADVRRRGAEARIGLRHAASGVVLDAHVSHVRATYLSGGGTRGSQVVYRPRDSGGIHLGLSRSRWTMDLRARYTGVRYPVPAPVNALDPFWTVHLSVAGRGEVFGWRIDPVVRVDRLLGERAPFIHAFPEPGRTFSFELRARSGP